MLEEAKSNYELAKKIKKDEDYPDQKINEITIKLNHIANQAIEKLKKYEDLIKNAADICPALGVKMEIAKLYANDSNYSPSFDRIDPKKGYTKNNIVIVSNRANRIKSDATVNEIRKVADFYEKLLKDK